MVSDVHSLNIAHWLTFGRTAYANPPSRRRVRDDKLSVRAQIGPHGGCEGDRIFRTVIGRHKVIRFSHIAFDEADVFKLSATNVYDGTILTSIAWNYPITISLKAFQAILEFAVIDVKR